MLIPEILSSMFGNKQMLLFEQFLEYWKRGKILFGLNSLNHSQCHATNFIIQYQLFQTLTALKIQHSWT